jgi:acylphosphatase
MQDFSSYMQHRVEARRERELRSDKILPDWTRMIKQGRLFYISGIVQGVGFRYFARRVAVGFGLAGYAKNLRDGRVEVYAIGSPQQLDRFAKELRRGPAAARVSEVMEEEAGIEEGYSKDFSIEHDTW